MTTNLDEQQTEWLARIDAAADAAALEAVRVAALGKQGAVTQLLKTLGGMSPGGAAGARARASTPCARR